MVLDDMVNHTLDQTIEDVPQDSELLVQDVSHRVGDAPRYDPNSPPEGWFVVAVCADAPVVSEATSVELAVVPSQAVTIEIRRDVREGQYLNAVWCEGRPYRA